MPSPEEDKRRKEIGKRLRDARKARNNMSTTYLNEMAGGCSTSNYIGNIESQTVSTPPYRYIEPFCRVLNIRTEWLLCGKGVMDNKNERIIEVRKDYGLSVFDFCKKLFRSSNQEDYAHYWDIEMGQVLPSDDEIQLICDTFSVNPEWIKNNTGKKYTEYHYVADRIKRHKEYSDAIASINDADRSLIAAKLLDLLEAFTSNNKKNEEPGD